VFVKEIMNYSHATLLFKPGVGMVLEVRAARLCIVVLLSVIVIV
jgi:hypothetical protein